ncbi:uncharacterized protein THITE_35727 [Thermothielavioides terrestris NRRL 8126]|uniref:Uncharacterized protein n=1 Tax=Thermothielavioides terrestris (strain ATCC 38088 / NRRL 8126) TaxID=578455 RepID=G2QY70_THETT|nr:uncharacterized protein THITE_35727 [Thermothielavioides terrestris NRRL 8126]AEO65364.1 hypothetical protein THITE_35727 [Thermothielavioides terrestris NRRL 8126]
MEAANAHYHNGHGQQSGPPLPASPTLTNPDMILPDYDDRSDSPDPDMNRASHPSLMMWKNAHDSSTAGPDIHQMFVATGLAGPRPYGPAGPVTPTTPIIYGNGTMLSDIGEVTEVESTVGKPSPTRTKSGIRRPGSPTRIGVNDVARRSSPTMGSSAVSKKKSKQSLTAKRERRGSMDSDSTITTQDHQGLFADFDDSVSVGDSVFQGDDEESMASSYVEGTAAVEPARPGVAKPDNVDRLSTYSTTSLSRRAEEILANAKRRLTTMEGNLTRARSSLQYTSPYGSDGSTPSPPLQRAATAMYPLANGAGSSASTADSAPGHTRMSSDVAMRNGLPYRVTLPRSQSALGAAGGYRQPLTASRSVDYIRGDKEEESHRRTPIANSLQETGLKPLTEAEVARLGEADSASQNARLEANPPSRNPWNGEESSVDGDAREHNTGDEHAEGNDTDYFDAEHEVHPEQATARVTDAGSLSPPAPALEAEGEVQDDGSDMLTENGDVDEDQQDEFHDADEADYMSESGESLYHDTVQHQISHEDREDAFDYEHFFLHSALGTMSLRRRASSESLTSEDSVETTRGPVANETKSDDGSAAEPRVWSRRNSSNSISTIDTFATAHEGRSLKSPALSEEVPNPPTRTNEGSIRAASAQSHRYRSGSTATTKRRSFNTGSTRPLTSQTGARDSDGSISPIAEEGRSSSVAETHASQTSRRLSVIHRPISTASSLHRPSISSFDSVGTNRSFPLVNKTSLPGSKKANSTGVLTPRDSPDQELNTIASRLMSDLGSAAAEQQQHHHGAAANGGGGGGEAKMMAFGPHPLEALLREDKYLVERLVASVGRCVLGLTENGRASAESRMYRRRLNAAMRVLEGFDAADDDAV